MYYACIQFVKCLLNDVLRSIQGNSFSIGFTDTKPKVRWSKQISNQTLNNLIKVDSEIEVKTLACVIQIYLQTDFQVVTRDTIFAVLFSIC